MQSRFQIADRKLIQVTDGPGQVSIYINPEESEKRYLVDDLKLDEHTLNSALDPDELSRLEFEPEHMAIIFKRPKNYSVQDQFLFKVGSTGVFLFKEQLIIVVSEDVPLFDGVQFNRIFSPTGLILKMIFRSIVHFRDHIKVIARISDDLQDKINKSMENRHLINLFALQKSLVYYLNSLNSNQALLEKLRMHAGKIGFSVDELEILDDTMIENAQCLKQAKIYSDILASLMDARASIVGNNLNVLMKTLNLIMLSIMVPTLVVSAFSMNVRIPLSEYSYAFWIIMGLALLSVFTMIWIWRYKRW